MKRPLTYYPPVMLLLIVAGWPARLFQQSLPYWYTQYAGDLLWAMLIYLFFAVLLRWRIRWIFSTAIVTTYTIEITQLFHPPWLDALRSCKFCALLLGYGFLWSDLVAYTLGIALGAGVDALIIRMRSTSEPAV